MARTITFHDGSQLRTTKAKVVGETKPEPPASPAPIYETPDGTRVYVGKSKETGKYPY